MDLSNENVIYIKSKKIEYLQFRKLLNYSDMISHAYVVGINQNFRTAKPGNEILSKEEFNKAIEGYKIERIKMLANAYERGSIKINKDLYKINERFKNNYIKKRKSMTFDQMEQYFQALSNKEEILYVLSREMTKFHLIYEIKNKLNNTLDIVENTLDEINNEHSPFNLKKEENEELLKILEK